MHAHHGLAPSAPASAARGRASFSSRDCSPPRNGGARTCRHTSSRDSAPPVRRIPARSCVRAREWDAPLFVRREILPSLVSTMEWGTGGAEASNEQPVPPVSRHRRKGTRMSPPVSGRNAGALQRFRGALQLGPRVAGRKVAAFEVTRGGDRAPLGPPRPPIGSETLVPVGRLLVRIGSHR